jgi:hypothetical protein
MMVGRGQGLSVDKTNAWDFNQHSTTIINKKNIIFYFTKQSIIPHGSKQHISMLFDHKRST